MTIISTFQQQLSGITDAIGSDGLRINSGGAVDRLRVQQLIDRLMSIVFPCLCREEGGLAGQVSAVSELLLQLLIPFVSEEIAAKKICLSFLSAIPTVRTLAQADVQAAYDGDPAAESTAEIIFSYPGLYAVTVCRLAHELYRLEVPLLPRMMTELAHSSTGIDIHPGARIGQSFFIDHGTGTVIGQTAVIGDRVKIYQGVTLGGLSTRGGQELRGQKRHPTIEDDVTIYAGATILGGETVIGRGCIIGANAFITRSVAPHTRVNTETPALQYTALRP